MMAELWEYKSTFLLFVLFHSLERIIPEFVYRNLFVCSAFSTFPLFSLFASNAQ